MIGQHLIRFVICFTVFIFTEMIIPRFTFADLFTIAILSIMITLSGWLVEFFLGGALNPFSRGIIAIIITAIGLIITSTISPETNITFLGLITASLWIGFIDFFIPVKGRYTIK